MGVKHLYTHCMETLVRGNGGPWGIPGGYLSFFFSFSQRLKSCDHIFPCIAIDFPLYRIHVESEWILLQFHSSDKNAITYGLAAVYFLSLPDV
jgi:hypothetical protein